MAAEMKAGGVLMVMQCRPRTRPSILLIRATRSLCSLSQELGSCQSSVLDSLSRMNMASMLVAIACSKRQVSATSR